MVKKRGQAWGIDVTLAAMIFVAGIVVFYLYTINYKSGEGLEVEEGRFEAGLVASSILSEGVPEDWNQSSVSKIGILTQGQINETKLARFYNLTSTDYERTKQLFGVRYDYFINLSAPLVIEGSLREGIGKRPDENAENTLKLTRFTNYQNKPVTIEVIAWN